MSPSFPDSPQLSSPSLDSDDVVTVTRLCRGPGPVLSTGCRNSPRFSALELWSLFPLQMGDTGAQSGALGCPGHTARTCLGSHLGGAVGSTAARCPSHICRVTHRRPFWVHIWGARAPRGLGRVTWLVGVGWAVQGQRGLEGRGDGAPALGPESARACQTAPSLELGKVH